MNQDIEDEDAKYVHNSTNLIWRWGYFVKIHDSNKL